MEAYMIQQNYTELVKSELIKDAIPNRAFHGFFEDYMTLHALIRIHKPKSFFEVGTNFGAGTKIIKNAMVTGEVFSLDLPFGEGDAPLYSNGKDYTGVNCNLPFTQLRGDSMTFDFSAYPCEGYFVDGCHDFEHPFKETTEILKLEPKLIVWHDLHCVTVQDAIQKAFELNNDYELYRVNGTRIAYALKR